MNLIPHNQSNKDKILLQIIDVSDRILKNEMKADKLVLTLINGAVSHELRNPLNALIGQKYSLIEFFNVFAMILE